jgi:AcrR family transcriptional regulator
VPLTPRDRMVRSAAVLMREQGVEAMSFSDVVVHSGAPRGSIYHYFPGGKAQLVEEATRWAGGFVSRRNGAAMEAGGPLGAVDASEQAWRAVLTESEFRAGCPIAAATVDGEQVPAARAAAGEVFRDWQSALATSLRSRGVADDRAHAVATLVYAGIEGGILLARAQRSIAVWETVIGELRTVVRSALAEAADESAGASTSD